MKPPEKSKDFREMFDHESKPSADQGTEQRIRKLESSVRFLFGLFLGGLLGHFLGMALFH